MKNYFPILLILCLIVYYGNITAQELQDTTKQFKDDYFDPDYKIPKNNNSKGGFTLGAGAVGGYSDYYGTGLTTYLAPGYRQNITKNFSLTAGLMLLSSTPVNISNTENYINSKSYQTTLLYLQGEYYLNKNISVHGTVFKDMNNFNSNMQTSVDFYSVGMRYDFKNNTSIGIDFSFSKGNLPMYHSQFGNHYNQYNSPFLW